jgi:ribosomal protein S18 acetylase RimI-like enzyme
MIEQYDKNRHNPEEVKSLLAMAVGYPTPEKLRNLLDFVYDIEGQFLFVTSDKDRIIGIIGVDVTAAPHGWILHLAVHPDYRKRGVGKGLIDQIMTELSLKSVSLEAGRDAVNFYRACGFTVMEIRSKWPGIQRYLCIKGQPPKSVLEYYRNLKLPD